MPKLRWLLAIISLLVFLIVGLRSAERYLTTPGLSIRQYEFISRHFGERKIMIHDTPYNDLTDGGIQAKVNLSNNMFQATLLITAALAGLLIAKDKEAGFVLGKVPELLMFICAGLLLLLSFVSHWLYLTEVSYMYFFAGQTYDAHHPSMPDISDPNINFLLTYQLRYFVFGVLLAFFTFFSAYVLKGGKKP